MNPKRIVLNHPWPEKDPVYAVAVRAVYDGKRLGLAGPAATADGDSYGNKPLIRFASCTRLIPMLRAARRMESLCLRLWETT
jgi:hypothetical protein